MDGIATPQEPVMQMGSVETIPDHITIREMVAFQSYGESHIAFDERYAFELTTVNGQPYQHKLTVGEQWTKLQTGWLGDDDNVGMIHVANINNAKQFVIPTPEEQEELDKHIILVSYSQKDEESFICPPGQTLRITPYADGYKNLHLRCLYRTARYRLTVYPK